ncbi:MAG: DMT family transporter [Rhodospirillaceae bacterium]|jgi:drug/metabolite transporter (DMT)-like permease|nr:DMT family transporter [Rhodospirillaceae bacterium]MBT5243172.1 DMT family transporter [Rhodospirillaceae bacterium]MBT5563397.1 DMT family transporter [Rhodospirillaceae bacterium]MBT6243711.1 DMT family transporter [Rhodospirillaceae bacterium]
MFYRLNPVRAAAVDETGNVRKGILLIVVAGALLASMDGLGKHLMQDNPVAVVIWSRFFFHVVVTFIFLGARGSYGFLRANRPGLQAIRGGFLLGATGTMYFAISLMPLADATAIQFIAPVLVTALSVPILGESVGIRTWAAVVVGFIGILLIVHPGFGQLQWASLLPILTAICLSLYLIMTRIMRSMDSAATTTFYSTATGLVVLSAMLPFFWDTPSALSWLLMTVLGSAGATGHYLMIRGYSLASASVLAPFSYFHLLASMSISLVVFGDVPDAWMLSGTALVIGSGLYVWFRASLVQKKT